MAISKKPPVEKKEVDLKEQIAIVDKRSQETSDQVKDLSTNINKLLEAMTAQDRPAVVSNKETKLEAADHENNQRVLFDFDPTTNDPVMLAEHSAVDPIERGKMTKEFNDEMFFMAEKVKIRISPVEGDHSPGMHLVGINGRTWILKAGEEYEVPRALVSQLIAAKKWRVESKKRANTVGFENGFKYLKHVSNGVNFTITQDTDRGHAWAKEWDSHCASEVLASSRV